MTGRLRVRAAALAAHLLANKTSSTSKCPKFGRKKDARNAGMLRNLVRAFRDGAGSMEQRLKMSGSGTAERLGERLSTSRYL